MQRQRRPSGRGKQHFSFALVVLAALGLPTRAAPPEAPRVEPATSAASVDLRPMFDNWNVQPRNQGARGTCSVFTVAAAIEYALGKSGKPGTCLSVEFLNWASNQTAGETHDGSFFSDLWDGFQKYGACPEEEMPYAAEFDPQRQPSPEALGHAAAMHEAGLQLHWIKPWDPNKGLDDEQFQAVKTTLQAGWPVCGGFLWPKRAEWTDDLLGWAPREGVRDGHSVILYGFRDDAAQPGGGVFLIRNSSRGPRHGAMSYKYVREYMNDAIWVESQAP